MAENNAPTLHELNAHLLATLLPATHGTTKDKKAARVAATTAEEQAAVEQLRAAGLAAPAATE